MKNRSRTAISLILMLVMVMSMTVSAHAADYNFSGTAQAEFYPDTSYEDAYGSEYNYGGRNAIDYDYEALPYGVYSSVKTGPAEKVREGLESIAPVDPFAYPAVYLKTAFTQAGGMVLPDGSMGIISIPALGIVRTVYNGETSSNMLKGMAHYAMTSGWDGNVCLCGHNRGCKMAIGSVKDLGIGDIITYSTIYGTRNYSVSYVGIISYTDGSRLQLTSDNRLTITTCLAGYPELRVCVQAVAID